MSGGARWPNGRAGMCGDPFNGPRLHEAGSIYGTGEVTGESIRRQSGSRKQEAPLGRLANLPDRDRWGQAGRPMKPGTPTHTPTHPPNPQASVHPFCLLQQCTSRAR